jgi:hypothetical protein
LCLTAPDLLFYIQEARLGFVMSVCQHVPRMRVASTGRISVQFDTGDFYEHLSLIFKRGYNGATISGSLQEDLRKFYCWCRGQQSAFKPPPPPPTHFDWNVRISEEAQTSLERATMLWNTHIAHLVMYGRTDKQTNGVLINERQASKRAWTSVDDAVPTTSHTQDMVDTGTHTNVLHEKGQLTFNGAFFVCDSEHCRFNPLNAELNPICPLLALFGAHHILHVSRIRVNDQNAWYVRKTWRPDNAQHVIQGPFYRLQYTHCTRIRPNLMEPNTWGGGASVFRSESLYKELSTWDTTNKLHKKLANSDWSRNVKFRL